MKKKTILVAAIAVMLVAALVVGGTLAYFTDKDNATNTFTVGNVDIQLIEQQRKLDADGNKTTDLEDFHQGQSLYPIVGSAQGAKDTLGMPTAKNYVDKMVTIQNTGSEKAYIRAYFAIPSALDNGYETFNAGMNVLHFNFGIRLKTALSPLPRARSGSGRTAASGITLRPPLMASSTTSTMLTTIRRSTPMLPPNSSFRACIWTSPLT